MDLEPFEDSVTQPSVDQPPPSDPLEQVVKIVCYKKLYFVIFLPEWRLTHLKKEDIAKY